MALAASHLQCFGRRLVSWKRGRLIIASAVDCAWAPRDIGAASVTQLVRLSFGGRMSGCPTRPRAQRWSGSRLGILVATDTSTALAVVRPILEMWFSSILVRTCVEGVNPERLQLASLTVASLGMTPSAVRFEHNVGGQCNGRLDVDRCLPRCGGEPQRCVDGDRGAQAPEAPHGIDFEPRCLAVLLSSRSRRDAPIGRHANRCARIGVRRKSAHCRSSGPGPAATSMNARRRAVAKRFNLPSTSRPLVSAGRPTAGESRSRVPTRDLSHLTDKV